MEKLQLAALLLCSTLLCTDIFAVSAYPNLITVSVGSGKTVNIYMRGDEHQRFAVTTDGYTVLNQAGVWWYATRSTDGYAVKSEYKLVAIDDETAELTQFKATCSKGIVPKRSESQTILMAPGTRRARNEGPMTGERKALVVLMQFQDLKFKKSRNEFDALFNNLNYQQDNAKGSVRDYYQWASQGQLDYLSDVYGPYTAKNRMNFYGSNEDQTVELCIEAIRSLPDTIDYSQYDNDGDGIVDNIHIIFAGYGEEAGASADAIWSHEYPHRISMKSEVGYSFAGYSCTPELRGNRGNNISYIGVVCHELGHALGAMDYYDTNYETGGNFLGTGKWDIMANGSWNDNGRTPSNFNPYVRSVIFGWNPLVTLKANEQIVMPMMTKGNAEQTPVLRVNTGSEDDYFLLENRQQEGFDTETPGAGLMIYHAHPYLERYRTTNTINATHPQGFYPVCASYSAPKQKDYGNINSAACPFPGTSRAKVFSTKSSPAAIAWNDRPANVNINAISMSADGSISFNTGEDVTDQDETSTTTEKDLLYKVSFETATDGILSVTPVIGNNEWRSYRKGSLIENASQIPEATDGKSILMLYSSKNGMSNESEAVSSYYDVVPLQDYYFTFDVYSSGMASLPAPVFSVYVEDERESRVFILDKTTDQWNHVELPLRFGSDRFRFKLNGIINVGGIFVDNICLYQNIVSSVTSTSNDNKLEWQARNGIVTMKSSKCCTFKLRNMYGHQIASSSLKANEPFTIPHVPSGVYLITTDDGYTTKIYIH